MRIIKKGHVKVILHRFMTPSPFTDCSVPYYSLIAPSLITNGIVESGCRHVIGAKVKQSGMHWAVDGLILLLLCDVLCLAPV